MFSSPTQALLGRHDTLQFEDHREKLSRRILELKDEIYALQECYNSLALPNRVPPEILCKIFLTAAANPDDDEGDLEWIRVTHVCRYWRRTALDCLELWTNLSFVNPEFTEVMIERSRNAPLSVEFGLECGANAHSVLRKALSITERLRRVTLTSSHLRGNPLKLASLLPVLSGPAPALEAMALLKYGADNDSVTLPTRFLEGTSPNLKDLRLFDIDVGNWTDLPLRPTLTRLRLHQSFVCEPNLTPNPGSPSWAQLIAALRDMPNLGELWLEGFLPGSNLPAPKNPSMPSTVPVTLPNLRSLKLAGQSVSIETLFELVRLPGASEVSVNFGHPQDALSFGRFLRRLAESWDLWRSTPVRDLEYGSGGDSSDGYHTFACRLNSKNPWTNKPIALEVLFPNPIPPGTTVGEYISTLQNEKGFSCLSSAGFTSNPPLTQEAWTATFGVLTTLKTIKFEFDSLSETFSQALGSCDDVASISNGGPAMQPFSALETLDFTLYDFDARTGSLLIEALKSKPPSSPMFEVRLFECFFLKSGILRRIVKSLPNVRVRLFSDDTDVTPSDSEEYDESEDGEEGSENGDGANSSDEDSPGSSNGYEDQDEDGQSEEISSESSEDSDGNGGAGMGVGDGGEEDEEGEGN